MPWASTPRPWARTPASLSQAEQAAIGKCGTIYEDFTNATQDGALAGIATLSDDIYHDVLKDAAVKNATTAWSAGMAKNGYSFNQPQTVFFQERQTMYGNSHQINPGEPISATANQAQIAAAASDANCTQSTDLAGIYFAVQASYEQQFVNANAQALNAAVRQSRTAYAKELNKLPALLKTAPAVPIDGHSDVGQQALARTSATRPNLAARRSPARRPAAIVTENAASPAAATPGDGGWMPAAANPKTFPKK